MELMLEDHAGLQVVHLAMVEEHLFPVPVTRLALHALVELRRRLTRPLDRIRDHLLRILFFSRVMTPRKLLKLRDFV
jgi:hypothetical protein